MKKTTVAVSLLVTALALALGFVVACGDSMPKPPSMPDGVPSGAPSAAPSGSSAPAK